MPSFFRALLLALLLLSQLIAHSQQDLRSDTISGWSVFTKGNELWAQHAGVPKLLKANWTHKRLVRMLTGLPFAYFMTESDPSIGKKEHLKIWVANEEQHAPSTNTFLIDLRTGVEIPVGDIQARLLFTTPTIIIYRTTIALTPILVLMDVQTLKQDTLDLPAVVKGATATGGISPNAQYILFFENKTWYSYEVLTGKRTALSTAMHTQLHWLYRDDLFSSPRGIAGWNASSTRVYLYDSYDLWSVDPTGKIPPKNLTNGYGARHHILFHVQEFQNESPQRVISFPLVLNAFNTDNKQNGFFLIKNEKGNDPEVLTMGDVQYDIMNNPYVPDGSNYTPRKDKNSDSFIVRRQTATLPPNLFSTTNFKTFRQLTFTPSDSNYTASLQQFTALDGQVRQGILYKPWNFDSSRKYPVIVHIYERKSDGLNSYLPLEPLTNGCNINIPSYTRNGYLVFTPDIYYQPGNPMQGAYDAVIGAAEYLEKLPYVDGKHMGIQGCSWGAMQLNYLVTHSDKFAAACSASGLGDWMTAYNSIIWNGMTKQDEFENGQFRMKATPWEMPEQYIHNSPIYAANHMNTPLLLMHTTNDGTCPFNNILSFFLGLRRLHKPAWLLQYNDGNHALTGPSALDFSTKMMQFFDYYLQGKQPPTWLSQQE